MARRPSQDSVEPEVETIQSPAPELEAAIAEVAPVETTTVAPVDPSLIEPSEAKKAEEPQSPVFPTKFYKQLGIPTCPVCGDSYRTDTYSQPLCSVGKQAPECPRLSK